MEGTYRISVRIWPYYSGEMRETAEKRVGPSNRSIDTEATDFDDAKKQADAFMRGIRTNPNVWQVTLTAISYIEKHSHAG
jgi:hypothetical protein